MTGVRSVFKRELWGYFSTPLAYVFLVLFLFSAGYLTFQQGFYEMRHASLAAFFISMPALFIFLAPAIAMRLWAEERKTNSIEILFSLPITTTQAVLGKFLAAWAVIALGLLLTFPMIITVYYLAAPGGSPDAGPIATGYLACLLLAGCYLAVGSFCSSLTRSQVIAFVLAVVLCSVFVYIDSPSALEHLSSVVPGEFVRATAERLSFQSRFESMQRGVVELRDLAFFVVLAAGFLWATVVTLEERRASG